jgi:hypothetical protein
MLPIASYEKALMGILGSWQGGTSFLGNLIVFIVYTAEEESQS